MTAHPLTPLLARATGGRRRRRARPPRRAPKGLNARQAAFVRHYVAGADGVRGNASRSFIAAGYSPKGANKMAARMMANAGIKAAIDAAHAKAEAEAGRKLRDWKELAGDAQVRLATLAAGQIPDPATPAHGRTLIGDRDDAAAANVILAANREILERAEPKKLQVQIEDPAGALAALLGVKPETVPPGEGES